MNSMLTIEEYGRRLRAGKAKSPSPKPRKKQKRASYKAGIAWIAENDEPSLSDREEVSWLVSVTLMAELFGKDLDQVARDVIKYRMRKA